MMRITVWKEYCRRLLLGGGLLIGTLALAQSPLDFLPPAPAWHGASERLMAAPDDPWITPSEKTGLTETPSYDDTVAWLRKLSDASPRIALRAFGHTAEGRELVVVIASREGASQSEALRANGRPTLLAQAGIHSGEIDGKDAGLMLLRDLAFGAPGRLLEKANLLFIPVLNADGHERASKWNRPNQRGPVRQGWRTTARNLNLNRDYVKADTPEMQALLRLLNEWQPSLYLDLHVTDGMDYQYDITFGFHGWDGSPAWSPHIGRWLDQTLRPALDAALKHAGHIPGPLVFPADRRDPAQGLALSLFNPRYSTGYGDLRHLPSVLVENHSLKPYKQRVLGTRVLLEAALKTLGEHAAALANATARDTAARPARVPMNWEPGEIRHTIAFLGINSETYLSPASGAKEVRWLGTPKTYPAVPVREDRPGIELRRPKAYWVPGTHPEIIARLKSHGVRLRTLTEPTTRKVARYRLVNPQPAAMPYEGHHRMQTRVKREIRAHTFPAGSVRVSTDQPLGDLAVVMLEPESVDSLLAWGFFPEILQRTEYIERYVVAPLGEQMLRDDPALKRQFEARLTADPVFAANPKARLNWFYERSRFFDQRYLLYPVGVEY